MSLRRCLIAVGQLTSTADVASNFAAVATLIREASSRGARMLFLPEATHSLGAAPGAPSAAERLDGPSMKKYASMAKDNNIWLSVGFPEKDEVIDAEADRESAASVDSVPRPAGASHAPPKRRGYNSHIIISDCGHIVGSYRKVGKPGSLNIVAMEELPLCKGMHLYSRHHFSPLMCRCICLTWTYPVRASVSERATVLHRAASW